MQSSAEWNGVPFSAHAQSVDSGSGTDAFSVINAIPELSYTSHFDAHQPWVMAAPFGRYPALDHATGLQRARDDRTPPAADQAKQAHAEKDDHKSRQEDCPPAKKVYDIPTLLRLKETQSAVPVMLRVKPEAIAGECRSYTASQTFLIRANVFFQKTFSSTWELQRHVDS